MKNLGWARRVMADIRWVYGWVRALLPLGLLVIGLFAMGCGGAEDPSQGDDSGAASLETDAPPNNGCGAIELVDGKTIVLPAPCAIYDAGAD